MSNFYSFSEQKGAFELIMPDSAYPPLARIQACARADWKPDLTRRPLGDDISGAI